jgi:hypothetical protein
VIILSEESASPMENSKWAELLREDSSRTNCAARNVLLVGGAEDDSIEALWVALQQLDKQQQQQLSFSTPLLYGIMHLEAVDSDEKQTVGLWLLKGCTDTLLQFPLNRKALPRSAVILHINLAQPHSISSTLTEWVAILENYIAEGGAAGLEASELQVLLQRVEQIVRSKGASRVAHPSLLNGGMKEDDTIGGQVQGRHDEKLGLEEDALPLPEGVLASSELLRKLFPALKDASLRLGVPVTVIASNCEALETLSDDVEKALMAAVRTFCMAIGAGLLLLPGRGGAADGGWRGCGAGVGGEGQASRETQIATARAYLQYLLFQAGHAPAAQVLERHAFFVPAGFDTRYTSP